MHDTIPPDGYRDLRPPMAAQLGPIENPRRGTVESSVRSFENYPESLPPSAASEQELVGCVIAGMRVRKLLGEGGMGQVYLAHHEAIGVERAVKVIGGLQAADEHAKARFRREAKVLSRLHHEHIIEVVNFGEFDGGAGDGRLFIAMEYIDGEDLAQIISQSGPMSLAAGLRVLTDLADAVHYAHSQGVVHRDLKPANVVLRGNQPDHSKIIDFGLVKLLENPSITKLTREDQIIGSPLYLAPEQAKSETELSGAVDVYALAGLAYQLLSGEPVFRPSEHPGMIAMVRAHCHQRPTLLSERCPDLLIPRPLDSLLESCLAKDPSHRPSAQELASHFAQLLGELETTGLSAPARQGDTASRADTGLHAIERHDAKAQARAVWPSLDGKLEAFRSSQQVALAKQVEELVLELCESVPASAPERDEVIAKVVQIRRTQDDLAQLGLQEALLASDLEERQGSAPTDLQQVRSSLHARVGQLESMLRTEFRNLFVQVCAREERQMSESAGQLYATLDAMLSSYAQASAGR